MLVVDDYPGCASIMCDLLRRFGHDSVAATTGSAALDAAATTEFDVALLDLGLPDVSGLEVARRLRARDPRPYLVALTGWSESWAAAARSAGFDALVPKPVRRAQLVEILREAEQVRDRRRA